VANPPNSGIQESIASLLAGIAAFAFDTVIVYILALRVSAILVSFWFAWVLRLFQISTMVRPGDWYMQHLELMTIVPALVAGYIDIGRIVPALLGGLIKERRATSGAMWAWSVPTIVLIYKMLQYHAPTSVLIGSSMSALRYFFDIQRVMPTFANLLASDPVRLLQQMTVTAPFYAGIAYSLGVLFHKYQIPAKLFSFEKPEETLPTETADQATPASPSSSPD
jgi:hypothetical protein